MNANHDPGLLIAVDGIDGAGKTTQVNALVEVLSRSGLDVVCSKEPTNGQFGSKLRESAQKGRLSLEDELELFLADRKEHVETLIRPSLEVGKVVILDRYFYSTIAYQGARGANVDEITAKILEDTPVPDKTFILDLEPSIALRRIQEGRKENPNEFEEEANLIAVRALFKAMTFKEIAFVDSTVPARALTKAILDNLIETSFKSHYCAKDYGCDGAYCMVRMANECKWAEIQKGIYDRIEQTHMA